MTRPGPSHIGHQRSRDVLRPASKSLQRLSPGPRADVMPELGSGTPLPTRLQPRLEQGLGHDFSRVRVHTDDRAAALAGALGAKAFATGDDVVFSAGRFEPGTAHGVELIAHELAHVAQQRQGGGPATAAEPRARSAAHEVSQGGSVSAQALGGADPGVHFDPEDENKPSVLPPMPNLNLSLPPLDYPKLQGIAAAHGQSFSMRDANDMAAEWKRSAAMLRLFGLGQGIRLGPLSWTGDELLNLSLGKQYADRLSREHPNAFDLSEQQFKQAYPGGFTIPPSLLSKSWSF